MITIAIAIPTAISLPDHRYHNILVLLAHLRLFRSEDGIDPYVRLLHKPKVRSALAVDLAEEFRPLLADSVVLTLVNNGSPRMM